MRNESGVSCGCMLLVLIFNVLIGGWSIDYLLWVFLEKNIPFWADGLIGLILGELSVPLAVVVAILRYFGVF